MVIGDRVQNFRWSQPDGSGSSGKLLAKVQHGHHGSAVKLQALAPAVPKVTSDQAADDDERNAAL